MNKTQLIEAVAAKLGSKKDAAEAVEAVFATISETVAAGEKVALLGFGSFEQVTRPARDARNPATGVVVRVPATAVPKFKAGATFKDAVKGRRTAA